MRLIKNCLNYQLIELGQQTLKLEELSNKVYQLLPIELANSCQVGSFSKGCLIITTPDASWASQLRYAMPQLRDALRQEGMYQLSSIKITLSEPGVGDKRPNLRVKHALSAEAKALIIHESQHCVYQPLKDALLKLADEKTSK